MEPKATKFKVGDLVRVKLDAVDTPTGIYGSFLGKACIIDRLRPDASDQQYPYVMYLLSEWRPGNPCNYAAQFLANDKELEPLSEEEKLLWKMRIPNLK